VLISLLTNLLRNAIKYMGASPTRRITVRVIDGPARRLFEVEDTGPGVPESIRDRVFEPHVRGPETGQPGIGLGLATVQRLARAHGGECGVRPRAGGGSVFWFDLPRATAAAASGPSAPDPVA
jgi:signal transduction histidine kinase